MNGQKTDFVWNGQNLAGETKNDVTTTYTYDMRGVIASKKNGAVTRYVKDPHGNVIGTSKNNELVGEYDYTAFGIELQSSGPSNPFRYCGEYYDTELDSVYLRNRYYNPSAGRFLTEDPVKDGLNWYSYCSYDPVNAWDPMGLEERYLTDLVSETTGTVTWEGGLKRARVSVGGHIRYYYLKNNKVVNDKIVIDDQDFNRTFDIIGEVTIASYWQTGEGRDISSAEIDSISGHSFIYYCEYGSFEHTYSTWNDNGENSFIDRDADWNLLSDWNTVMYTKKITRHQRYSMAEYLNNDDNIKWSWTRTCSVFASEVFNVATGISFGYTLTPKSLQEKIEGMY